MDKDQSQLFPWDKALFFMVKSLRWIPHLMLPRTPPLLRLAPGGTGHRTGCHRPSDPARCGWEFLGLTMENSAYPLVMTNSLPWKITMLLIGKPSISMDHLLLFGGLEHLFSLGKTHGFLRKCLIGGRDYINVPSGYFPKTVCHGKSPPCYSVR